jgi:hypothetical protein
MDIAYIAQGKIHVKRGDAAPQILESQFGQNVRQRAIDLEKRNAWKTQGTGSQFMRGGMFGARANAEDMRIAVNGLTRRGDQFIYSLETSDIGGIFRLSSDGREEQRLLHTADYRVREVVADENGERLAATFDHRGYSTIAILRADGLDPNEATEGDSNDMAPSWVQGTSDRVIFQSAGIGRNAAGMAIARGPFAIHELDLNGSELRTLLEDENSDLMNPKMDARGQLFYIKRPWKNPFAKQPWWRGLLDFVLFPFRLLFAMFQFLNFFTVRYTGKTLTNSGGAQQREADLKQMMIWGNMVDARQAARNPGNDDAPDLVPKNWELVCRDHTGTTSTLARGVLSFDLCADGSLLYTNGSAVFVRTPEGKTERVVKDGLISKVIALG